MTYLDNHATTRVDPRVLEAMLPYFSEQYGNAGSSSHGLGENANRAVQEATSSLAKCLGAKPEEFVFTSGATESNNLAIRGIAERKRRRGNHIVSVTTEHHAVLEPLRRLEQRDYEVTLLPVEQYPSPRAGWLDPQHVKDALRDDTILVSVMMANNEIGVVQSLDEIGEICRQHKVLLHSDATQAVGKVPINLAELPVDLMSFTAHKIYGPKGTGALYVRSGLPKIRLETQISGGGQQAGLRSGTLNTPGIVGLARSLEICVETLEEEAERLKQLRKRLWQGLSDHLDDVELCGPGLKESGPGRLPLRLPGNLNVSFGNVDGEALLLALDQYAISSGATCASQDPGPSHVLLALGMGEDLARSSLRFGLGRFNTEEEIEQAVRSVVPAVKKLREMTSS